jgi:hypothetical protein
VLTSAFVSDHSPDSADVACQRRRHPKSFKSSDICFVVLAPKAPSNRLPFIAEIDRRPSRKAF